MGDFDQQQNWLVQNLDLLLGTLGGVPYSTTGSGTGTQTSMATRNVGRGAAGGALARAAAGSTSVPTARPAAPWSAAFWEHSTDGIRQCRVGRRTHQ